MANEREIADNIDNTKGDAPVRSVQGEVRRTGFLSIVQLITMLMSVLRNKLSVVLLSKSGVGLSAIFMNVSNFMSNTSNLGVSFSSIKEISSVFEKGDQIQLQDAVRVVRTWRVDRSAGHFIKPRSITSHKLLCIWPYPAYCVLLYALSNGWLYVGYSRRTLHP